MKKNTLLKSNKEVSQENDIDHIPNALEMPSEGEDYDSNFEIYTSQEVIKPVHDNNKDNNSIIDYKDNDRENRNKQHTNNSKSPSELKNRSNNNTNSNLNALSNNINYQKNKTTTKALTVTGNPNEEQLRQKITEQAHRLTQLETYKDICEQRILQLNPCHKIPVTENDLRIKINPYDNNYNYHFILPSEKLPIDKLKEAYDKLYKHTQEIKLEKDEILSSLRTETINNEEQRNYIEMLRQTIESAILKNGLSSILQHQCTISSSNYSNNVDILIDISKIKSESDKYRKDLILSGVLINELRNEIEVLKKTNEDMSLKKERIKDNLENGILELEKAQNKLKNLENEKEQIYNNYQMTKSENTLLQSKLDDTCSSLKRKELSLQENNRTVSMLESQLQNQLQLQSKLQEYQNSMGKLYEDFDQLVKEKSGYELENTELKELQCNSEKEIVQLKNKLLKLEECYQNENRNLYETNSSIERERNSLNEIITNKEKEILILNEKLDINEAKHSRTIQEFENEIEDLKTNLITKTESFEKDKSNSNNINKELKRELLMTSSDKQLIYDELNKSKNENIKLQNEISKLVNEIVSKENRINKLNEQFDDVHKTSKSLEEERDGLKIKSDSLFLEIRYWKEKYEKDITGRIGEINCLNKDLNQKSSTIEELLTARNLLQEQILAKENFIRNLEDQIRVNNETILQLQNLKDELIKKIDKLTLDNQKEIKNNFELSMKIQNLNFEIETLSNLLRELEYERDKLHAENNNLIRQQDEMVKLEKENQSQKQNLSINLKYFKQNFMNCYSTANNFFKNFNSFLLMNGYDKEHGEADNQNQKENEKLHFNSINFTDEFIKLIRHYNYNNNSELNLNETVQQLENWIRVVFTDIEILLKHIPLQNQSMRIISEQLLKYEDKIRNMELQQEEKNSKERKLHLETKEISEELRINKREKENIEQKHEKLIKDFKFQKSENQKLKEDLFTLDESTRDKDHLLKNASYQVEALEERIIILIKEKKYLESLLTKVSKSHPLRDMWRIVNQIMNVSDTLAQLERDRMKIEDNELYNYDEAEIGSSANSNSNCNNRLKTLTHEYDRRISEKRELILNLETEMKELELSEKNINNTLYDYEYRIKILQKELGDCREELRRFKSVTYLNDAFIDRKSPGHSNAFAESYPQAFFSQDKLNSNSLDYFDRDKDRERNREMADTFNSFNTYNRLDSLNSDQCRLSANNDTDGYYFNPISRGVPLMRKNNKSDYVSSLSVSDNF